MSHEFDCIVCGEICVDLPVRPVDRARPLNVQGTMRVDAIQPGTGGIVPNSGIAMAKMGLRTAGFGCVGDDAWADLLSGRLNAAGLNTDRIISLADQPTSVTAILIDGEGNHNFAFHAGASGHMDADLIHQHIDVFDRSRFCLFGYYGLFGKLAEELPEILQKIRLRGCRTALDAACGGGSLQPLDRILPHLDVYVPSYDEARAQTGADDPQAMIRIFREFAPHALLGVKLGAHGALLSQTKESWTEIAPVSPPGDIVDTTGAGDCFYAGLICGLVRGMSVRNSGRLAAAAGACAVTGNGANTALPDFETLCRLAEIE